MNEKDRGEFEAFQEAHGRECYLHYSGQKDRLELEPIYERYSDLFSFTRISELRALADQIAAGGELARRSAAHLLQFAVDAFLQNQVRRITEEIARIEASATLRIGGEEIGYREASAKLANEDSPRVRREIFSRQLEVVRGLDDLRRERILELHEWSGRLGWENYADLFRSISGVDFEALNRQCQRFVEDTSELYRQNLSKALLRDLHLAPQEAHRADLFALLRASKYDAFFPSGGLEALYRDTLGNLGIRTSQQLNIHVDAVSRAKKHPRAFCAVVRVPQEIKLVIAPVGGLPDYHALLHESGHAQHFGWTSPSLAAEFRYTGDAALTEMFAFLFEHLLEDSKWLQHQLHVGAEQGLGRRSLLMRLLKIRRYAAKLQFECELHAADALSALPDRYASLMSEATGVAWEPEEYLSDLDDGFYSASYLRAWFFEAQFCDSLRTKFGYQWWAQHRAGNLLKEMWNTGLQYSADEMADQADLGPIGADALLEQFRSAFSTARRR